MGVERRESTWYERLTRGAPLAVFLAAGFFVVYQFFPILLPVLELVVIAMLLALVLRTVVNALEGFGLPGWLAVIVMVLGLGAFLALLWLVIIPNVAQQIQTFISQAPQYVGRLHDVLKGLPFIPDLSRIVQRLQDFISQLVNSIPSLATTLVSLVGAIVAAIFLAVYMAASPDPLVAGVLRLAPEDRREGFRRFIELLRDRMRGWIVGTVLVAVFVGTTGGIGLWILGVPLPLTFGVLAGLLNVVPYLGSILGGVLPALVALAQDGPVKALLVLALFIVINQLEGNVFQPLIMGRAVELHPAMILVSFLVLGTLLGFIVGAILAVPTAVFAGVLLDTFAPKKPSGKVEEPEDEDPGSGGSRNDD